MAGAPQLVAGALVAVVPLVGAAAAPEEAVGVAALAPQLVAGEEAAASRPAERAAEAAHRQWALGRVARRARR